MKTLKEAESGEMKYAFNQITAGDKILVILSVAGLEEKYTKFNEVDLYRIIYANKNKYKALFNDFVFSTNGTGPYSALLERVLMRMKIACVLTSISPDYVEYKLAKDTKAYIKLHILPKITRDDYFALESIGEQLKQKLGD